MSNYPDLLKPNGIQISGQCHIGLLRKNNEDAIYTQLKPSMAMVADGMGGHNAGEVASNMLVECLRTSIPTALSNCQTQASIDACIMSCIELANQTIYTASLRDNKLSGMGTTLVLAVLQNEMANIFYVGDSRAYLFRKNKLTRITKDHSLLQEYIDKGIIDKNNKSAHSIKNIITRAIGVNTHVTIDNIKIKTLNDDLFLLCSDGLTDMLDEKTIETIITPSIPISEKTSKLIEDACLAGGKDNISVIILQKN